MAPPWIVLATDRQIIGGNLLAVRRGHGFKLTISLERARRFADEPAATMFAKQCQKLDSTYLFTPFQLY
jgi:hypothetical protein